MPTGIYLRTEEHRRAIKDGLQNSSKPLGRTVGIPLTLEEKRKRSERGKRYRHSEESKRRISEALKGRKPKAASFRGRRHSIATREKISVAQRGRMWSEEKKTAHSLALKARGVSSISKGQQRLVKQLQESGCEVFHRGWPDLLVVDPQGKIRAIEVKRPNGSLTEDQIAVHTILRSLGLTVEVIHLENGD